MDQRDATRFAIAQTRHNLSVIAQELSHRSSTRYLKRRAGHFLLVRIMRVGAAISRHPVRNAVIALAASSAVVAIGVARRRRMLGAHPKR